MQKQPKTPTDLLNKIAEILNNLRIDFFVSGGFAVSVWGKPRFTADIDLVIHLEEKNIDQLAGKLKSEFPDAYIDPLQMRDALKNNGEFNIIEPNIGMKIDFWIVYNKDYDKLRLRRSIKKDIGREVRFISPEDLIISKLQWMQKDNSSRHADDIKSILEISKVDNDYINEWVKKLGLEKEYKRI
ncbi:MAG: nucleotidyl transferase AbiEii/AbiGii toxin family protein [Candidatus Berkelbacteria bacterium]|nr:nucleotidyl transferase AbiEii/AbiGii toxin family protein [Candidatus Berkelbacteria bacterium]